MPTDFYEVLKVRKDATEAEIKAAFRKLARLYHPDVNGNKNDSRFKEVAEAYEVLSDPDKRAQYDKHGHAGPIIIQTKKDKYTLEGGTLVGDLADVYRAKGSKGEDVAFKIVRDPKNNDLLENEWKMLNFVRPPDKPEEKHFRFFPKPIETLRISADGKHRQTNIMTWAEGYHTFEKIRSAFNGQLKMEHGIWMFRRILSALSWVNQGKKIVHGGLVPTNLMAFSGTGGIYDHGVKMLDWSYAVPVGEKVKSIAPQWEVFYPPEILNKKPVDESTDIYMAAKCVLYVLGADVEAGYMPHHVPPHIPSWLLGFLAGCSLGPQSQRPHDAYELLKEFTNHTIHKNGPRKYVPFDVPLSA